MSDADETLRVTNAEIVITVDPNQVVKIGDTVQVTARATFAPPGAWLSLNVPGVGSARVSADGMAVVDGTTARAGHYTITARLMVGNRVLARARTALVVVKIHRIEHSDSDLQLRLANGVTPEITLKAVTFPSGHGNLTEWSVSPQAGATPAAGVGAQFKLRFTSAGTYTVTARVGTSSRQVQIVVAGPKKPKGK